VIVVLESLNDIEVNVFIILGLEIEDELQNLGYKRQHLGSDTNGMDNCESNKVEVEVLDFPPIDNTGLA